MYLSRPTLKEMRFARLHKYHARLSLLRDIANLHNSGVLDQQDYEKLSKAIVGALVADFVGQSVNKYLEKTLPAALSPENLLEALA